MNELSVLTWFSNRKKLNVAKLFNTATTARGVLIVLQHTKFSTKLASNYTTDFPHLTEDGMVAIFSGIRQGTAPRNQSILNNGVEHKIWHCDYVKPRRSRDRINLVIKYVNCADLDG